MCHSLILTVVVSAGIEAKPLLGLFVFKLCDENFEILFCYIVWEIENHTEQALLKELL